MSTESKKSKQAPGQKEPIRDPEEIGRIMQEGAGKLNPDMPLPPPSFLEMQGAFEEYRPGESLRVSFPVRPEYDNPMRRMQGGFICAAMDNTMGPLSFLVTGGAAVTLSLNVDFVRGIKAGDTLTCVASVLSRSRTNLIMDVEAFDSRGKLVARSSSQFQVFGTTRGK
ncbi:MAG: PaaI family thioesterase [bacterium]|nr:PaaI family thioesterase [bacterium]